MNINKVFDLLDDWKHLPAYQLERRADIFFAAHLAEILEIELQKGEDLVIPEFPVRVGSVSDKYPNSNKSFKIDYVVYKAKESKMYLIELKTDQDSRRSTQDWYLKRAVEIGFNGMIEGLLKIFNATTSKSKYKYLLDKLVTVDLLKHKDDVYTAYNTKIISMIIYIQPLNKDGEENVISFGDIIKKLSYLEDPITKRFVESLKQWELEADQKNRKARRPKD